MCDKVRGSAEGFDEEPEFDGQDVTDVLSSRA